MVTRPVAVATLKPPADSDASAARDASPAPHTVAVATAHLNRRAPVNSGLDTGSTGAVAQFPALLSGAAPDYPEPARERGIEGRVTLQIVVDPAGHVERDVIVVESVPALDGAAIDAVRHWRFAPGRDRAGVPVRASVRVPLRFVLR